MRRFLTSLALVVVGIAAAIAVIAFFVSRDEATIGTVMTVLAPRPA